MLSGGESGLELHKFLICPRNCEVPAMQTQKKQTFNQRNFPKQMRVKSNYVLHKLMLDHETVACNFEHGSARFFELLIL
jgi:hypothetical protein